VTGVDGVDARLVAAGIDAHMLCQCQTIDWYLTIDQYNTSVKVQWESYLGRVFNQITLEDEDCSDVDVRRFAPSAMALIRIVGRAHLAKPYVGGSLVGEHSDRSGIAMIMLRIASKSVGTALA